MSSERICHGAVAHESDNPTGLAGALRGIVQAVDVRRHTDMSAWNLMIFPDCDPWLIPRGVPGGEDGNEERING